MAKIRTATIVKAAEQAYTPVKTDYSGYVEGMIAINKLITNKVIKKYDTSHPNFKPEPKVVEEVDGNAKEDDIYNERVYQAPIEQNGNL